MDFKIRHWDYDYDEERTRHFGPFPGLKIAGEKQTLCDICVRLKVGDPQIWWLFDVLRIRTAINRSKMAYVQSNPYGGCHPNFGASRTRSTAWDGSRTSWRRKPHSCRVASRWSKCRRFEGENHPSFRWEIYGNMGMIWNDMGFSVTQDSSASSRMFLLCFIGESWYSHWKMGYGH